MRIATRIAAFVLLALLSSIPVSAQIWAGSVKATGSDYGNYNNVAITPDGMKGLIANPATRKLVIFNLYNAEVLQEIYLGDNLEPSQITISPNGLYACVLNISVSGTRSCVSIVDLSSYTVRTFTPANAQFTNFGNIAITADSAYGIVCNHNTAYRRAFVFRLEDGGQHREFPSNFDLSRAYISPDGTWALLPCYDNGSGSDRLMVLNLNNWTTATYSAKSGARFDMQVSGKSYYCLNNVVFSPDSRYAYIGTCGPNNNGLLAVDSQNWAQSAQRLHTFDGTTQGGIGQIGISPDGSRVVAASLLSGNLYILRMSGVELVQNQALPLLTNLSSQGFSSFCNIVMAPDNGVGYISDDFGNRLLGFDYLSVAGTGSWSIGEGPAALAISSAGDNLCAVNYASSTAGVDVVDIFDLLAGDLNRNRRLDPTDHSLLKGMLCESSAQVPRPSSADCNWDGTLDLLDVFAFRIASGL